MLFSRSGLILNENETLLALVYISHHIKEEIDLRITILIIFMKAR